MYLVSRGAPHATMVHKAARAESSWSSVDWLRHFEEEERFLFPRFPRYAQRILTQQHEYFRTQLRRFGTIDNQAMKKHAAMEDAYTEQLG